MKFLFSPQKGTIIFPILQMQTRFSDLLKDTEKQIPELGLHTTSSDARSWAPPAVMKHHHVFSILTSFLVVSYLPYLYFLF
jgi:hypothetical protein